ncbi:MAG: FtsX-like permease family protein [Chitinivibrionales bacterium]|nr:FtsX-like permease family protein [Chitinivibrionales bacterium]
MKSLLIIAFRNLLRHKRRTILTGIIISFGLWMYIFMDSLMAGLDRGSIDNMITLSTSAVKIHTQKYDKNRESFPLEYGIQVGDQIKQAIQDHDRVEAITPRTQFLGELSNYEESIPVAGTVIAPHSDTAVFSLNPYLEGEYFSENNQQEIILGKTLAGDLNVKPGDFITLYGLTKYDTRNADDFKIVGLYNTTDPELNKNAVFITYDAANTFLDLENTVTELNVGLKRRVNFKNLLTDMKEVRQIVETEFPSLTTYTFAELGAGVLELARQKRLWGAGMTLVFLLIAGVGIVNSVLMSVYERIREIGVLRALGFEGDRVMHMFMLEGVIIGFIGSLAGVILGCITVVYLSTWGWPLDKLYGDMAVDTTGFPVWGTIYGEWNVPLIIGSFFFGLVTALIASIPPAGKAASMEVTHALRFV